MNDLVYFSLYPYKQTSLKGKGSEKLKPRFYGPYKGIRKVGEVGYELELPEGSKIHNVFQVSCLKKVICKNLSSSETLPPLDDEGKLILILETIVKARERKLRRITIKEYLVQWKDFPSEEANWEDEIFLQHPNLAFLEDKQYWVGRIVISPSQ